MSLIDLSTSLAPSFSHIYVEERAKNYSKTLEILDHFKSSTIIFVKHYKDVFNQNKQDFKAQKQTQKLILAIKEKPFLYKGSQYTDGFGFEQFYYISTMLNCLYACNYCYLQGLYPSANIVVFVNKKDFFNAIIKLLNKPLLVCLSYDTDSLAVEKFIGENRDWINFAKEHKNLHLELRTKSANFFTISNLEPLNQIVIAWTLSPQSIINKYEGKTASLAKRLASINEALNLKWKIRICFDPILYSSEFHKIYPDFIDEVFNTIDALKIYEVTIGSFRMSSSHLKIIKKMKHTSLAFYPYEVKNQMAVYPKKIQEEILKTMKNKILKYIPKERLRVWSM